MQKLITTTAITHQISLKNSSGGYDKYNITLSQADYLMGELAKKPSFISIPEKITKSQCAIYPAHGAIIEPIPEKERVFQGYTKKKKEILNEERFQECKEKAQKWCEDNLSWFEYGTERSKQVMIESVARGLYFK